MRRVPSLLVLGLMSLLTGPLAADQVVLNDGRTLNTKKPPEIRGRQAILVLADGKLVSIPASEIDTAKTAALAKKAVETAKAPAAPAIVAPTLAEAARATRDGKKATVVLTDQDVAGGWLEPADEKKGAGAGRVVVSNVSAKKTGNGTAVTGSVQNVGDAAVEGVAVTVEVLGDQGKTVASAFGQLSADTLAPGEKASFTAQLDAAAAVQNVRALPRWRESKKASGEPEPATSAGKPGAAKGEAPAAEPAPTPAPPPPPPAEPPPAPRSPDVAAPPANAPVGAPNQPGGTYMPQPSSDQPKPPGGGA